MDELMKVLLDNQVSLGVMDFPSDEPMWAIRSNLGEYFCAFSTDPDITVEDFVSWYIKPAAGAIRANREAEEREVRDDG
jgi:hypothetical protein